MRITTKLLVAAALCGAVLVPASPASSGQASPLVVSGVASCISETEVQIAWTVRNASVDEFTLDISGAVLLTHDNQPVTLSPSTIAFDETATGTSNVPAGPGTATLHVSVTQNGGGDAIPRQFAGEGSGTVEVPDCRQATTTTTAPAETTTTAPAETTTTVQAQSAAPIPLTPAYTG